jgi:hypothetical protein
MIRVERARIAAEMYAARRERDAAFAGIEVGFGEPGWDMLLLLYVADAEGRAATRAELFAGTNVEASIAERYILWMISQALAAEAGAGAVCLREAGRAKMDAYLDRLGTRRDDRKFMH